MLSPPEARFRGIDSTNRYSTGGTSVNGARHKSAHLIPTNNVTTKQGVTVRARIDPALTVEDVVRQLCVNLKLRDPPAMYALRDDADELVTNENMRKKIKEKAHLKYVSPSPVAGRHSSM